VRYVRRTGVRRTDCVPIVVLNPTTSMADKDVRIKFATASYCEELLQGEELLLGAAVRSYCKIRQVKRGDGC